MVWANLLSGIIGALVGSLLGGLLTLLAARQQNRANASLQADHWAREEDISFKTAIETIDPILNRVASLCAQRTNAADLESTNRELVSQINIARNRCQSPEITQLLVRLQGAAVWARFRDTSGPQALRDWLEVTEVYGKINELVFGSSSGDITPYVEAASAGKGLPPLK